MENWYFSEDGDEFIINSLDIPRDWKNVLHSGYDAPLVYWARFSATGSGTVFCRDAKGNHLNLSAGDGGRALWLRDDDSNTVWTPAPAPVPAAVENYCCTVGLVSSTISSNFQGISVSWRVFVPPRASHEIWSITIENTGETERSLSVFPYFSLGLDGFKTSYDWGSWHKVIDYVPALQGLFARNCYPNSAPELYTAMMLSSAEPVGSAGGNEDFFGPANTRSQPRLVNGGNLAFKSVMHDETGSCLGLQIPAKLAPKEKVRIDVAVGVGLNHEHAAHVLELIRKPEEVDGLHAAALADEKKRASQSTITTGDQRIDRHFNWWLKKQIHTSISFKTGIRDNLQAALAYSAVDYPIARQVIVDVLSHQYEDGSFPHTWGPLNEAKYGDMPTWCLIVVPEAIRESGDFALLDEAVQFIQPGGSVAGQSGNVLEHLLRAARYLDGDTGSHGLSLIHRADWNDDLDGPGRNGKGESVMVSMGFCRGLRECASLFRFRGLTGYALEFEACYKRWSDQINSQAWDGSWYLRAWTANGEAVGSSANDEGKIYLNSQNWAELAGIAPADRSEAMWKSVDMHLETPLGMKVAEPTYTKFDPMVGSLSAALPGFYVNGVYNHAGAFTIVADALAGRANAAWRIVSAIVPDSADNPVEKSQCEPFAITNCYRSDSLRPGLSGDVWHTGSAAWVFWGLSAWIFGIRPEWNELSIDPRIPDVLNKVTIDRVWRGCRYEVTITRSEEKKSEFPLRIPHVEGRSNFSINLTI